MSDLRLRARSAAEIVDAAFQLYRRDAAEYLLVTALAYAPALVGQLLILGAASGIEAVSAVPSIATLGLFAFSFFAFALMSAVLTRYSSDVYLGRLPELGSVARTAIRRLPSLLGAVVAMVIVMLIGFVPVGLAAATRNPSAIVLAVLAAMAWMVYVFARYFAILQIVVLEDAGIPAAFQRSALLSHGRKMHILLTLLLVFVILFVLSFAFMIAAAITGSTVVLTVVQTCYTIAAYPLVGISQMVLYYDTRIRAEGFDIEVMASALGQGQAPESVAP